MNYEELRQHIQEYTPKELELMKQQKKSSGPEAVHGKPRLLESGLFMKPEDKIIVYRQDRFEDVSAHKHDYIELCYVWSGVCNQTIEGKKIMTIQGDVCIFDTYAVHALEAAGNKDIIINILMRQEFFDTAFLSRMTRAGIVSEFLVDAVTKSRQKKHYLYFPSHQNQHVQEIMERILMEYYTADLGMEEILESYVIILFTELLRTWRDQSREKADVSEKVQILELLSYIEENYEHCTLTDMGKVFGLHGNYLTALLKEKTGRSFVEHVQEQKLKKARALLENSDIPVTEVVLMSGYNNMNFFYKKFREMTGLTPAKYREQFRN